MIFKLSKNLDSKAELKAFLKKNNIKISDKKVQQELERVATQQDEYDRRLYRASEKARPYMPVYNKISRQYGTITPTTEEEGYRATRKKETYAKPKYTRIGKVYPGNVYKKTQYVVGKKKYTKPQESYTVIKRTPEQYRTTLVTKSFYEEDPIKKRKREGLSKKKTPKKRRYKKFKISRLQDPYYRITGKKKYKSSELLKLLRERYGTVGRL